jgi:hypothetical protein
MFLIIAGWLLSGEKDAPTSLPSARGRVTGFITFTALATGTKNAQASTPDQIIARRFMPLLASKVEIHSRDMTNPNVDDPMQGSKERVAVEKVGVATESPRNCVFDVCGLDYTIARSLIQSE